MGTPEVSETPRAIASTDSSERPYGVTGRGTVSSSGTEIRPVGRPYTSSPLRSTTYSRAPVLAAAVRVACVEDSVRSSADSGVIRDAGSYTPKCATTCGA